MGAYCNGNVSLSPSYDVASAQDPRFCKHVHDNVHGNIYLDSVIFINHSIFSFFFRILLSFSYKESEYADSLLFIFFCNCSVLQLSLKFIDTEQFQRHVWNFLFFFCSVWLFVNCVVFSFVFFCLYCRLRELKQLGELIHVSWIQLIR